MTGLTASRSHTSCGTYCECHLYAPVFRSTATMESVYRLSPGRIAPYRSGEGLPTTKNAVLVLVSIAGVIHTPPPKVWKNELSFARAAFSVSMLRCRSRPVASLVAHEPSCPLSGIV